MKKAILLGLLIMLSLANSVTLADAVFGEIFELRQPNATTVKVRIYGDEFYRVVESLDGYTLTQEQKTGFICYAYLSENGNDLVSTGVPAGTVRPADLGLVPHTRIKKEAARAKAIAAAESILGITKKAEETLGLVYESAQAPSTGNVRGICLIVDFADEPGTIQPAEVSNFCNQVGYGSFGNNGSVRDYFFDVSDGHLTYTNYVPAAYYRALHNKTYYDNPSEPAGSKARELVLEALNDLKNNGFDFSQYDSDGDNFIDAINCLYAGNCASSWSMGLWPHCGGLSFSANGVRASKYQIADMGGTLTIRTFCHENGHLVCNWPDLYDYDFDSRGAGNYCLMAYGASETNPVEPCAYLKGLAGWANIILLACSQPGLPLTAGMNTFYKFVYSGHPNEYFLIENRQKSSRDAALPDAGLAIWHIDTQGSNDNQQMTASQHYEASLEQADGKWDLENNRNYGNAGDLWKVPTYTAFGPVSTPNSNWWDGSQSEMTIGAISASGNTMTFSFFEGSAKYSGGTGEPNDPYRIATPEDLIDLSICEEDWGKYFIVVNDIDMEGHTITQPIGIWSNAFTGVFDGNDHRIWNFTWSSDGIDYVGLFGYVGDSGQIENLGMENVDVNAIMGYSVGGLVGLNSWSSTITNCYSTGSVSGTNFIGGLVGANEGTITACYSMGNVGGNEFVGGLVGENTATMTIKDCYSTASVSGHRSVGGLVGENWWGTITDCYSTGSVTGTEYVGGLVGYDEEGVVTASFWDVNTSGQSTSADGTPKTTTEMKTKTTFTTASWDFVNIWDICDGTNYPRLQRQIPIVGDFACPYGVDFVDFAILSSAWQSKPSDPDWNPACDISQPKDDFIDELDLAVLCENWLEGTTP